MSAVLRAVCVATAAVTTAPLAGTLAAQVSFTRIRDAAREPASWLTYSGTYDSHRHSALDELTPANVSGLRLVWIHQLGNSQSEAEVTEGVNARSRATTRTAPYAP